MKKYNLFTLDFYKKHNAKTSNPKIEEIILGRYEDILIKPIDSFEQAERLLSIITPDEKIIGLFNENNYPVSTLVLYSLEDTAKEQKDGKTYFWEAKAYPNLIYQSITLLSCGSIYSNELSIVADNLHNDLSLKQFDNLEFFCFGTSGAYSMCIISRAECVSQLIEFVNTLEKNILTEANKEEICSSYTLLSYCGEDKLISSFETMLGNENESDYYANIQITHTNRFAAEDFLSRAKNVLDKNAVAYTTLGEFDLCMHIPINKLPLSIYLEDGILNSNGKFYKSHILQSCTRISKKEQLEYYCEDSDFDFISTKKYQAQDEAVNQIFTKVNHLLQNLFNSQKSTMYHSNLKMLKRIYNIVNVDFRRAFSLSPTSYYAKDLFCLFNASIKFTQDIFDQEHNIDDFSLVCDIAKLVTDAAYNMIQANDYSISEPYSFLYNSSICQSIKQSYLGFIKLLLISIYGNCSVKQSEIIPVVNFDPKLNVVKSDIYISSNSNPSTSLADVSRIVAFNLPYDAIYREIVYLPLLIHEVMHYICPHDRNSRNKVLFKLYLKQYFSLMTRNLCDDIVNIDFINFTNNWIEENFNSIIRHVETLNAINFDSISTIFSAELEVVFKNAFSKYGKMSKVNDGIILQVYINYIKDLKSYFSKNNAFPDNIFSIIFSDNNFSHESIRQKVMLKGKNSEAIIILNSFSQGIKEIISDVMMIYHCELNMESYIALLITSMLDVDINTIFGTQQIIRIGYMFYFYGFKYENDFKFSEQMKQKICDIVDSINNLHKCEDNYFITIEEALKKFRIFYFSSISDIDEIVGYYNISSYSIKNDIKDEKIKKSMNTLYNILRFIKLSFRYFGLKTDEDKDRRFITKNIIPIMQILNNQLSLDEIHEYYNNIQETKSVPSSSLSQNYIIPSNLQEEIQFPFTLYLSSNGIEQSILLIKRILTNNDTEKLWYRGQRNADWKLTPSLFRHGNEYRNKLIDAYEQFRAQACESMEIYSNIDSDSDWIACMQHYFVPTHFLDWSEQPLTSLYFAMENYFDFPCEFAKDGVAPCGKSECEFAALYVLNPLRMNLMFKKIKGIPNISISYNGNSYKEYILPKRDDTGKVTILKTSGFFENQYLSSYLPLAVTTSQINSRIKAQQGHFVVYNLSVDYGDVSDIKDITCLYNLQMELYKQALKKKENFYPFLIKLLIPRNKKGNVVNTIKNYGIRKSNFYPELMNIGSDITKLIF